MLTLAVRRTGNRACRTTRAAPNGPRHSLAGRGTLVVERQRAAAAVMPPRKDGNENRSNGRPDSPGQRLSILRGNAVAQRANGSGVRPK